MTEPGNRSTAECAEELLLQRWRQGERVDIAEFLAAQPAPQPTQLVNLLLIDQRQRWQVGERIPAESYLRRYPTLDADPEAVVELVYSEFLLREEHSERPTLEEYRSRFPCYHDRLCLQVELHLALQGSGTSSPGAAAARAPTLVTPAETAAELSGAPQVPGYEILGELGQGGMGIVYKARQVALDRPCALKMILHGGRGSVPDRQRFHAEAQAIARLQHPNIVTVYEVGEHEGKPFIALEFCPGGSLDRKLGGTPLGPGEAATLVRTLAEAMHVAHAANIVHRDLKPANVLLSFSRETPASASPEALAGVSRLNEAIPKITDFGLAKRLDEVGQTQTGVVMGTPSYMAPEQAQGQKDVGPAADVYALGAILYECLTGRPPFKAATALDTVLQVLRDEPVAPRQLNARVPADLETVCLKCLNKVPAKRYPSAGELAADLRRFQAGEPIVARPTGTVERTVKWVRRRPTLAALLAVSALATITFVAAVLVYNSRLGRALENEASARRTVETTLTDLYTATGLMADERHDPALAMLWFAHAAARAGEDHERRDYNLARVRAWRRQLSWVPFRGLPHDDVNVFRVCAFHKGGNFLITVGSKDQCSLWDVQREHRLPLPGGDRPIRSAAWSPDGRWLALGSATGEVGLYTFPDGETAENIAHDGPVEVLAFSPDSRYLAVGGGDARVWELRARRFATPSLPHPRPVMGLAFSPRGDRLVTACDDGQARAWAVPGGAGADRPLFTVPHKGDWNWNNRRVGRPFPPAWVNDQLLVTPTGEHCAVLDAATGKPLRLLAGAPGQPFALAASPDQRHVAFAADAGLSLWNALTGERVGLVPQQGIWAATSLTFSPDGRYLIAGCRDRAAHIWKVPELTPVEQVLRHQGPVCATATTDDGRLLATAQVDGLVRVWCAADVPADRRLEREDSCGIPRLSRDGRFLAAAGVSNQGCNRHATRLWAADTGEPVGRWVRPGGIILDAVPSPDGKRLAVLSVPERLDALGAGKSVSPEAQGSLTVWDPLANEAEPVRISMPSEPRNLDYSPDGRQVAVVCGLGEILLIDPVLGQVLRQWQAGPRTWTETIGWFNSDVRFSPDGQSVMARCGDVVTVWVWETASGQLRYQSPSDNLLRGEVRFSPDGRLLATAGREVGFWELASGQCLGSLPVHPSWVRTTEFAPDGNHVVTASADGEARVYEWRTGRLVCPPLQHARGVWGAAFTPDGRRVVTVSTDQTARAWEIRTGKPLTPPLPLASPGIALSVLPGGERLAVGSELTGLTIFDLSDLSRDDGLSAADACAWTELVSGRRLHDGGDPVSLTSDDWVKRLREFRARRPAGLWNADPLAWWRRSAEEAAAARQWFAAVFHLDRLVEAEPDRAEHRQCRAEAYLALGNHARAIADCDVVLRQAPSARALQTRGRAYFGEGKPAQAVADFTEAIRLDPRHAELYTDRGIARARAGEMDAAVADQKSAIRWQGDSARSWACYALLHLQLGDSAAYSRACSSMVERFGATTDADSAYWTAWACVLAEGALADPDHLPVLANRALALAPASKEARQLRGVALYRAGRFAEAVPLLTQDVATAEGRTLYVLAMAQQCLGKTEEAPKSLAAANAWVEKGRAGQNPAAGEAMQFWDNRAVLELARREAEKLVSRVKDGPGGG
jgi:WD40 repeat protein/serine/threonine protein kinase/Flp pilus assembly protein TadD